MPGGRFKTHLLFPALLAILAVASASHAEAPVFAIDQATSTFTFHVKASRKIEGRFDKATASLTFTTPEVSTGVLDIKIDAASVYTGNSREDGFLKGGKVFDVKNHPDITFRSTKIAQTGPDAFAVAGDFTVGGVTKSQTLALKVTHAGSAGDIYGTMGISRKDYGMTGSVPFVTIADRVDVAVDLKARRVRGPPVAVKP
jgi:polyisoprenoid-binding protein YceI